MIRRKASYEKELYVIFDKLELMCKHIEAAIEKSVTALVTRDTEPAKAVCEYEKKADKLERKIEKACLKLLIMEQPVARDFREVSAILKMITDLERIGDQAWDIAKITMNFRNDEYTKKLDHIPKMADIVIQMVKDGVLAFINRDLELAQSIEQADDKADELFNFAVADLISDIKKNPENAEQNINLLLITKYLERIGDHAVNVGEWVEYAITGKRK